MVLNGLEPSTPGHLAKSAFGSGFRAIRWAESGISENQYVGVVQVDFGRLPRRALINPSGSELDGLRGRLTSGSYNNTRDTTAIRLHHIVRLQHLSANAFFSSFSDHSFGPVRAECRCQNISWQSGLEDYTRRQ